MFAFVQQAFAFLRSLFPVNDQEPADYPFAASDIAQLHRIGGGMVAASVDQPTWEGMLLDSYFVRLTSQVSIFGKQVLYRILRDGQDDAARDALDERLRLLSGDPDRLAILTEACKSLRHADTDIATLLFEEDLPAVPKWAGQGWLLGVGLTASVGAVVLSPLAWLGAGFFLYQLIAIQMRFHERLAVWNRAMRSLQMMLRGASLLGAIDHPLLREVARDSALAGKINRGLSRFVVDLVPGMREYRDWFMLANVKHYFKGVGIVGLHRQFLRDCYLRVAGVEADLALARHLLACGPTCRAERSDGAVVIEQAVHPLLERPAALTIALHGRGAFISGQNGVGKSTLLRTIGLNLLAARAFGFCYASRASVPMLPVFASMQSEDSMLGGESLYIAELQRARELLAAAAGPGRIICLIDEIFRGTNHLESVSAAAAVLDELARHGTVIVSSHNLVLASLLEHRLAPLCVAPGADGALALSPGVLVQTNGIALLAQRGFGTDIEAKAARVAGWLGAWLAHPEGAGGVLRGGAVELRRA
ncbi:hypothetical protein Q4S45_05890 [Massilia sp. R2A-15]|uniref:MutS-related protein n=1 Tax=Massilia sp. R2A-15 TaxID=3064278 RepID=UPI0027324DD4|nr:hypothetical protein [Massilia sp. R2A-15]WLI90649.1 hypothetical protein Q4S45_05890 [Massilia sp. R2A-15]